MIAENGWGLIPIPSFAHVKIMLRTKPVLVDCDLKGIFTEWKGIIRGITFARVLLSLFCFMFPRTMFVRGLLACTLSGLFSWGTCRRALNEFCGRVVEGGERIAILREYIGMAAGCCGIAGTIAFVCHMFLLGGRGNLSAEWIKDPVLLHLVGWVVVLDCFMRGCIYLDVREAFGSGIRRASQFVRWQQHLLSSEIFVTNAVPLSPP
jgi:hypothetical protein